MKGRRKEKNLLHCFKHNRVVSHPKIVISAPDFDLRLGIRGMRDREFGRQPIDSVEITVRLVIVLFLQFVGVKLFVIKPAGVNRALLHVAARSCLKRLRSSGLMSTGSLGSFEGVAAFLRGRQLLCHPGSGKSLASMRALRDVTRGDIDAFVLVDFDYVDTLSEASKTLNELSRTFGESGTHHRAFGSLLGELGEARELRGGGGAQCTNGGSLGTSQERANGSEF